MEKIIEFSNVTKTYRLGQFGGGTLRADLQSFFARIRKKPDPNSGVYAAETKKGYINALNDVSFSVNKGERLGIIGKNGAGKSTLLKLLSKITAPTKGKICYDGRISSMLEVGTGFHPELTGRENIYLSGAVLGMTKKEISEKIDKIIEFSELEKFIDTPIKRYSSGMFVKLAFSVAAHLDAEIVIMDEVLAVGDAAFQKKCIDKMCEDSDFGGRTVLYVSHNMNTIRRLCDRCIVLKEGKIVFDGDVEQAISIYEKDDYRDYKKDYDYSDIKRPTGLSLKAVVTRASFIKEDGFLVKDNLEFKLRFSAKESITDLCARFTILSRTKEAIASLVLKPFNLKEGESTVSFKINLEELCRGDYIARGIFFKAEKNGAVFIDAIPELFPFKKDSDFADLKDVFWRDAAFGAVRLYDAKITKIER